jgi:hypothetical protein
MKFFNIIGNTAPFELSPILEVSARLLWECTVRLWLIWISQQYVYTAKLSGLRPTPKPNLEDLVCVPKPHSGRVAQLHSQAPGSHFTAFYGSQCYDGSIISHLHAEIMKPLRNFIITLHLPVIYVRQPSKISSGFLFPVERCIINS